MPWFLPCVPRMPKIMVFGASQSCVHRFSYNFPLVQQFSVDTHRLLAVPKRKTGTHGLEIVMSIN